MRHHFTKSERLALQVMAVLHMEFTDMESGRIRVAPWRAATTTARRINLRRVYRTVTFMVDEPTSPLHSGVKVHLAGSESEEFEGEEVKKKTVWRVERITMGCSNPDHPERGTAWYGLVIPEPTSNLHLDFPMYLLENARAVASVDA